MEQAQTLPFYKLWRKLCESNFEIATDNFMLLHETLPILGVPETATDFCFLLRKLWLTPDMDALQFDEIVRSFLNTFKENENAKENEQKVKPTPATKEKPTQKEEEKQPNNQTENLYDIPLEQEYIYVSIRRTDENQNITVPNEETNEGGHFLLKGNYFPLKENHLRQAGLYLKKLGNRQITDRIDLAATIKQWAKVGELADLAYFRQSKTEILLLADDRGSMEAFAKMTDLIYHNLQAANLNITLRYFYNTITTIYDNRYQMRGSSLRSIGKQQNLCIFILSDGGATRGRYNTKRYEQNLKDFQQCLEISKRTVWINPVPKHRWNDSTAGELSQQLPMFEATREGISAAVRFLAKK